MMKLFIMQCFVSIVLFMIFTQPSQAQDTMGRSGKVFTCLLAEKVPFEKLFYKNGGDFVEMPTRKQRRSMQLKWRPSESFEIYKQEISAEGETLYKLIGSTIVKTTSRELMFIVGLAKSDSKLPLEVVCLDDSLNGFPVGSFRFANYTGTPLFVKVDTKVSKLPKNKVVTVDSQSEENGGFVPVAYGNSKGELLHFTRLYTHKLSREIVFIRKSPDPKRKFQFLFIPQNIPREKVLDLSQSN